MKNLCELPKGVKNELEAAVTTASSDGFLKITDGRCAGSDPNLKDCLTNKRGSTRLKELYNKYIEPENKAKLNLTEWVKGPGKGQQYQADEVRFALWAFHDFNPLWSSTGQTYDGTIERLTFREYLTPNRRLTSVFGKRGGNWDVAPINVCKKPLQ